MSDWSQPMCGLCYTTTFGREPYRHKRLWPEYCCMCNKRTAEGIYARMDPYAVPYPTFEDDRPGDGFC